MIPAAITHMDPAWEECGLYWGGLRDPPYALQSAVDMGDGFEMPDALDPVEFLTPVDTRNDAHHPVSEPSQSHHGCISL